MQQPTLIQIAQQMVQKAVSLGQTPVAFMMNTTTSRAISESLIGECKKRMSLFGRFWFWLRKGGIAPRLETLCGIPVLIAPTMDDGGLFLQAMARNPGFSQGQGQHAQLAAPGPRAEFVKREPVAQADGATDEVRPTLNDLASSNGNFPSSSDVIMRAMEKVEELSGVAVVRVYKNGDIDLCANIEKYALQGVLQHAQMWVMQNGQ
jgi:hypothetical protein